MSAEFYHDPVLDIWHRYITTGAGDDGARARIADSWRRCRKAGVAPDNDTLHSRLDSRRLEATLEAKRELIRVAKPFMANLYRFVQGSGFVVVLTDEHGYILEMFGDEDTLKNPLTKNFFRGACWSEREAGTNAIGTALELKEPIQVSGAEHYCRKHHCLTCSSAPILDGSGRVIGILDMSGASHASHLHTLGMVVAAAEAIMAQLAIFKKNRELALANNRLTNIFNTMSDGVIMVDSTGVVSQVNPAAREILGKGEQEVMGMPVDRVFGGSAPLTRRMLHTRESYQDVELIVENKKSVCHCLASGESVTDETGKVTGGVVILRPIQQIQNLVNRFSGYYATLQFSDIIGQSSEILETIRVASLAATTNSNILLQGESGTGKEIFAQAIHNKSEWRNGPFVAINCGVIPRELIGSELFGYVEGAFTGAKKGGKPGKFEQAAGGTLFLDEIGDMPLEQQIALLRVLQEKSLTRIGSDRVIPVNVRVICATHKNLLQEVEKGTFRQDLYYRLNVISVTIPPLRNRTGDIPLLFRHFLDRIAKDRNTRFYVDSEVIGCLQKFSWPGNVRELQNVVERAASLAETGVITPDYLPAELQERYSPASAAPSRLPIDALRPDLSRHQRRQFAGDTERQRILLLLSMHGGNVTTVARELGVSRNTLYRKMRLYAIEN